MFTKGLCFSAAAILVAGLLSCGSSGPTVKTAIAAPIIQSISPTSVPVGVANVAITVTGENFAEGSIVQLNGANLPTVFVSSTQLTATIPAGFNATGTVTITVGSPAATNGTTSTAALSVVNPEPDLTSLGTAAVVAGSGGFTLTVNGSGFVSGATVYVNGTSRTTTFVNSGQLTAAITASDVAGAAGTVDAVTVENPAPAGGTSAALSFTLENPSATISTISPTVAVIGSGGFTLTVNGSGFVSGATVYVNGGSRVTTFVSSGQLTAAVLATDVMGFAGSVDGVSVQNPAPSGGVSNLASFSLENPAATISSVNPMSQLAGTSGTVNINGSGFVQGAVVQLAGQVVPVSYNGPTSLSIPIVPSTSVGMLDITVTNPAPSAGVSNVVTFNNMAAGPSVSIVPVSLDLYGNVIASTGVMSPNARYFAFANLLYDSCLEAASGCSPATIEYDSLSIGYDSTRLAGPPTPDGAYVASSSQPGGAGTGDLEYATTCVNGSSGCSMYNQVLDPGPIFGLSSITPDGRYVGYSGATTDGTNYPGYFYETCTGATPPCTQVPVSVTSAGLSIPYLSATSLYSVYAAQDTSNPAVMLHQSTENVTQNWVTKDTALSDLTQSCSSPVISGDAGYITYSCSIAGLNEVFFESTCVNGGVNCNLTPHQLTSGNSGLGQNSTVGGVASGGRYVTYSTANATVSGTDLGYDMVFIYDTCNGAGPGCTPQALPVCLSGQGAIADADCTGGQISDDGLYILFYSNADNLDNGVAGASYVVSNPFLGG